MKKLQLEQVKEFVKQLDETSINIDDFYQIFSFAFDNSEEMIKTNMFGKVFEIDQVKLLNYLVEEYKYFSSQKDFKNDDNVKSLIASISVDKYFTNEHLDYKNSHFVSKYSPSISTLNVYLNLMLGVLRNFPQKDPHETLLVDIANKAISISKAVSNLITDGFETEAFSTWRTLHESECILAIIAKNKDVAVKNYLKHMNYGIAFRGGLDEDTTNKVFEKIKAEMKALDLKSKDMKKYIEYGWITALPEYKEIEGVKLNFRDGIEKLAGLTSYSSIYEMASEIAHSSPLLIYSRNKYFFSLAMLELYESFFRIEKIFCSIYLVNISKIEAEKFSEMRKLYYPMLLANYEKISKQFKEINTKKASR